MSSRYTINHDEADARVLLMCAEILKHLDLAGRGGVDVSASIAEVMARRDEVLRSRGIEPNGQGTCK